MNGPQTTNPSDSPQVTALMWMLSPFACGLAAVAGLLAAWSERGSILWRHARVATWLYGVSMAIFLPVFLVGWMYGSFAWGGPGPLALGITVALGAVGISAAVVGAIMALRSSR